MSTHSQTNRTTNNDDDSEDDAAVAFAAVDFAGVDFTAVDDAETTAAVHSYRKLLAWEKDLAFQDFAWTTATATADATTVEEEACVRLGQLLAAGDYATILRSPAACQLVEGLPTDTAETTSVAQRLTDQTIQQAASSPGACFQLQVVAVAALNLFWQANYTGPSLADDNDSLALQDIHPHPPLRQALQADIQDTEASVTVTHKVGSLQNAVLAELAVDGDWPCQVCEVPYFLLLARAILTGLVTTNSDSTTATTEEGSVFCGVYLWQARALVAHQRLLQIREASLSLSPLLDQAFDQCLAAWDSDSTATSTEPNPRVATILLERGLADHYFARQGQGRASFRQAQARSGLTVQVTGAVGKRTKFQQEATAQLLVKAESTSVPASVPSTKAVEATAAPEDMVQAQLIPHSEDEIILERIRFDNEKENEVAHLNTLDQSILLALCLDVKNSNPADGLTGEEMGAFLARVLDHQDDWMIYSTALLERSWLEFERTRARERAILQIQALADQHTNRLTLTQSTMESVEESAPVQDRLRNLHLIVYPPRWEMIQDLGDRYASLGVVTSAAELYTEVELWDDVVACYSRAGKKSKAEEIVRERLALQETPRMWAALGDLTGDPDYYQRAVELSHGRYSNAYTSLGHFYFEKGAMELAAENYEASLKVRPLAPSTWFRLGTIGMQLKRWDTALRAFSEVVLQEPEEADAWANVAAIHMRNQQPLEAYPALNEALRYQRSNWRIWISKLYICLDLEKYDEAIQACNTLIDLRSHKQASANVPPLEEKCIRGLVGGVIQSVRDNLGNEAGVASAQRTLSRAHELLERINASGKAEPWVLETLTFFHEQLGKNDKVLEYRMDEYRAIQGVVGWEKDRQMVEKITGIALHIVSLHKQAGAKEGITKARFLIRGIIRKVKSVYIDETSLPPEVARLEEALAELEALA